MATGVYYILNTIDKKMYVGSAAKSISKRMTSHRYYLNKGEHKNEHLQCAWDKYKKDVFEFGVIEECLPEDCIILEQFWIDYYETCDNSKGYNKSPAAGSPLGFKHTPKTRAKVSAALKGKKKSPEHAARIKAGKQSLSEETKEKMRRAMTPERRAKIAQEVSARRQAERWVRI